MTCHVACYTAAIATMCIKLLSDANVSGHGKIWRWSSPNTCSSKSSYIINSLCPILEQSHMAGSHYIFIGCLGIMGASWAFPYGGAWLPFTTGNDIIGENERTNVRTQPAVLQRSTLTCAQGVLAL